LSHNPLFTPLPLGQMTLPNRIVMAPLTRMRAGRGFAPTALNVEYYAQRASAGLIIAEGTAISPYAHGYPNGPGIYTGQQIDGWRAVTDAVHTRGGRIALQIQHCGRNSHSSLIPGGGRPVSPSATLPDIPSLTADFEQVPAQRPRPLETSEIPDLVDTYRQAAVNAIDAGFDAVELQGANSHLIEQFLDDGTNLRTDAYGGPTTHRARFLLDIVDAAASAIGATRVGVRLSPFGQYGGIRDSDPKSLFTHVIGELDRRGVAYLHLIEARGSELGLTDELHPDAPNNAELFREIFNGPLISAGAYLPDTAAQALGSGTADAIAFGRLYIANPDLVHRIHHNVALNGYDRATFYGGGEHGYTDYPASA
jgi:N-ethylmaleimide reductase